MQKLSDKVTLCIGVGAQRAGTTWLASYFAGHPEILMSPIKELHYFDALWGTPRMARWDQMFLDKFRNQMSRITVDDIRNNSQEWRAVDGVRDRVFMIGGHHDKYLEYFAKRIGRRTVAAEITPSYAQLDAASFTSIQGIHPRTKFIFLLRNPIDRLWSALRHRQRKSKYSDQAIEKLISGKGIKLRSDYRHTLKALADAVPPQNLFIEFFENLFDREVIQRLCRFLDVGYHDAALQNPVNRAKEKPLSVEHRRQIGKRLLPVYEYCHDQFGDRLPSPWRTDFELLNRG